MLTSIETLKTLKKDENACKWIALPRNWAKLNTYGFRSADGSAGAGMILRDDTGNIIFSSCRTLFSCRDVMEAELGACMKGISFVSPTFRGAHFFGRLTQLRW